MAKNKSTEAAQALPKKAQAGPRKPVRPKVAPIEPQPLAISPENRDLQERASDIAEQALEQARKFDASEAIGFVKKHSIPLAILGLSAFWIYSESQRPKNQEKLSRVKGKLNNRLSEMKVKASDLKEKANEQLGEYSGSAQQALSHAGENPFIVAACAGGIGLGLGLMLPLSAFENETFRSAREQIKETVQEKVEQVTETVTALKEKALEIKEQVEEKVGAGASSEG